MAKITLTITKSEEGKFTVKAGTSVGGGQDKIKDKDLEDVKQFVGKIIKEMDKKNLIGRK